MVKPVVPIVKLRARRADPVIPMPTINWPRPLFFVFKPLRDRWTRFRIWRLNHYADGLLKEAEHHRNAAKMHTAASSMFWSKATAIRIAARKLLGDLS